MPDSYRFPRAACSRSMASNSALKLPSPKPRAPWRSMISKKIGGRSPSGLGNIVRGGMTGGGGKDLEQVARGLAVDEDAQRLEVLERLGDLAHPLRDVVVVGL